MEFSVPAFRLENALSVGAKMVRPWFELLSCEFILSAVCVPLRSLMKVVNCPAFSRTWVMLVGPAGAGATWAEIVWIKRLRKRRGRKWNSFAIALRWLRITKKTKIFVTSGRRKGCGVVIYTKERGGRIASPGRGFPSGDR
ncbi:hypothetical protein CR513_59994, partial [Mucuna pruriens]